MDTETIPERRKRLAKERKQRYLRRLKIEKYGIENANVNMTGKHGNQACGSKNGRWNGGRWIHQDGYIAVAVPANHHLRMKNGYAYQHQMQAEKMLGRKLERGETVHHINGNVKDNATCNLMVLDRSGHALIHATAAKRNNLGQFLPGLKRISG